MTIGSALTRCLLYHKRQRRDRRVPLCEVHVRSSGRVAFTTAPYIRVLADDNFLRLILLFVYSFVQLDPHAGRIGNRVHALTENIFLRDNHVAGGPVIFRRGHGAHRLR